MFLALPKALGATLPPRSLWPCCVWAVGVRHVQVLMGLRQPRSTFQKRPKGLSYALTCFWGDWTHPLGSTMDANQ